MRGFLALALLACFMVALFWLMRWVVPEANRDLVTYMLGQLSGFAAAGVLFYFNTSKSSADKNDMIREPSHVDDAGAPVPIRHARPLPEPTFGREGDAP